MPYYHIKIWYTIQTRTNPPIFKNVDEEELDLSEESIRVFVKQYHEGKVHFCGKLIDSSMIHALDIRKTDITLNGSANGNADNLTDFLPKRIKRVIEVTTHNISREVLYGNIFRDPPSSIQNEIAEMKELVRSLSKEVAVESYLHRIERLLVMNQEKLQNALNEEMGSLKNALGEDVEKEVGQKKATRLWSFFEKAATISDLIDFAHHIRDLLAFLHAEKIIPIVIPAILEIVSK